MQDPRAEAQPFDRQIVDALAEGIVWHAADGRVVDANAAAAPILGLDRDELIGRRPDDPRWHVVREDGSAWPADELPATVALRTGQPQRDAIMGVQAPDGSRRWICLHAMPMADAGGPTVTGVVVSFADVTPHIQLREALRAATQELAALYDQAPCGYHTLDADGRYQRINDTELQWLGLPREAVLGRMSPRDFVSEDDKALFARHFPMIRAGQRLDGLEFELVGAQGQHRFVRLTATPVQDAGGRFVGTRSVLHDVSDSHARALALQSLSAEQAVALDNDMVSIVRLRERTITWTNRAFDHLFGYEHGEMIGHTTRALFADEAAFLALGQEAYPLLRDGKTFRAQLALRRKDGSTVWTDCSGILLRPDTTEVMWFAIDVTEQRRMEALRLRSAELEAHNRQLEDRSRMHRLFLSGLSHELRTPLNAVIGYAELLGITGAADDPAKVRSYAGKIAASGRHQLSMIDAMLDMVNLEAARLVFRPQRLQPEALAGEVVAMLESRAAEHGVTIAVDVAPGLGELVLDPLRLRQVLLSYLDNAIRFSRRGGRVELRLRAEGVDRVCIEVEDHGIGIAAADLPVLFSKFHQISSGPTKAYSGTGIGLALVKMLVEAQGGTVAVRSAPGKGSVFTAVLPRVSA